MNKMQYIYVNEHLISRSLICPICFNVLEDPHTHTVCDSAFCRSCLIQLVEPSCPVCRYYWNDLLLVEYNPYLPKASRLIRNMLDELSVECLQCHTIRCRGEFDHECRPMKNSLSIKTKKWQNFQIILSVIVMLLSILFIYSHQSVVLERAIDRHDELIQDIGIDIDKYVLDKIFYLIVKMIESFIPIFTFSLFLWFGILFYGNQFVSKRASRVLKNFIETLIIINFIGYSLYY